MYSAKIFYAFLFLFFHTNYLAINAVSRLEINRTFSKLNVNNILQLMYKIHRIRV